LRPGRSSFILNAGLGKWSADEETAGLTAFSAALLGIYARTPGLTKEDGIRPSQQGTALAKDVWMLGIGLGLTVDALTDRS
jgi:hypothetical protein